MGGFISVTLSKEKAISDSLRDPTKTPILMQFEFQNTYGTSHFRLNTDQYSIIPEEKEVILQDGLEFEIEEVIEEQEV